LDVGDRSSWYCVLDEAGAVLMEQKLPTTPKAMKEIFGKMPPAGWHWKPGCIRHLGEPANPGDISPDISAYGR